MSHPRAMLICLVVTSAAPHGAARGQSGEPSPEFILAGFRDSRERLRTGVYRARGVKVEHDPTSGRLEGPVELFVAFDHDVGKLRFDRTETVRAFLADDSSAGRAKKSALLTGKYVQTPERVVVWTDRKTRSGRNDVTIYPAEAKAPREASPFDIRIAGISNLMGYINNGQMPKIVDNYIKRAAGGRVSRIDRTIVRLEWQDDTVRTSIEFDETIGYLPTRYELRWVRPVRGQPNDPPTDVSTVRWTRVNDTWVPAQLLVRHGPEARPSMSYDLTFEWERVNQPVPPEFFMTRGMDLPDGTPIGAGIPEPGAPLAQLGKIGDLEPDPRLAMIEADPPTKSWPWWAWTGIGLLGAGLAALGGYLLYRRRVRPIPA